MDEVYDLKFLCNFYGFENEEDKLLTELKVFHSSFSLPKQEKKSTLCMALNCFKGTVRVICQIFFSESERGGIYLLKNQISSPSPYVKCYTTGLQRYGM